MKDVFLFIGVTLIFFACNSKVEKKATSHWVSGDSLCVDGPAIVFNPTVYQGFSGQEFEVIHKESRKAMHYFQKSLAKDSIYIDVVDYVLIAYGKKEAPKSSCFSFKNDSALAVVVSKEGKIIPIYNYLTKADYLLALDGKTPKITNDSPTPEAISKEEILKKMESDGQAVNLLDSKKK
jgi:hypothetical protein